MRAAATVENFMIKESREVKGGGRGLSTSECEVATMLSRLERARLYTFPKTILADVFHLYDAC